MAQITVVAKIDGGIHLKHGEIKKGRKYTIEEEDFGAELFERPYPGFESPLEKIDRERREAREAEKKADAGNGEIPPESTFVNEGDVGEAVPASSDVENQEGGN